jgi:Calx-beta domain
MKLHYTQKLLKIMPIAIASLGMAVSSPSLSAAAPNVSIPLNNKKVGNPIGGKKQNLIADSGNLTLSPSKVYTYTTTGSVIGRAPIGGTTDVINLSDIFPQPIPIDSFINPGIIPNPDGILPVVKKAKFSREVPTPAGTIKVSGKYSLQISESGQAGFEITNVKILDPSGEPIPGSLQFTKGSKVLVNTASVVGFKVKSLNVSEGAGTASIVVERFGNKKGDAKVTIVTEDNEAKAGVDYTAINQEITFVEGQPSEITVTIPIIDNTIDEAVRRFNVKLSNPSAGVVFGARAATSVRIQDND